MDITLKADHTIRMSIEGKPAFPSGQWRVEGNELIQDLKINFRAMGLPPMHTATETPEQLGPFATHVIREQVLEITSEGLVTNGATYARVK